MKKIAVFVFDGLADWEIGLATYELRTRAEHEIVTVGLSKESIVSGGGLRILPDYALSELDPENLDMMIFPGGAMWEDFSSEDLTAATKKIVRNGIPIAAICSATIFLAKNGFFKDVLHTSNSSDFLQDEAPGYEGQENYRGYPAICDGGIITAAGTAPADFAYLILQELAVYTEKNLMEFCAFWHCGLEPV